MSCPNCGSDKHVHCTKKRDVEAIETLVNDGATVPEAATQVAAETIARLEVWESRLKDSVEELEAAKRQLEALEQEWPAKHRDGYADTRALVHATKREIEMLIPALRLAHKHATGGKQ